MMLNKPAPIVSSALWHQVYNAMYTLPLMHICTSHLAKIAPHSESVYNLESQFHHASFLLQPWKLLGHLFLQCQKKSSIRLLRELNSRGDAGAIKMHVEANCMQNTVAHRAG
jgi:hypothetical protein